MLGVSLTMSSHNSSSCLIFDRASEGVVETVITLLAHHDGVGKGGYRLLQGAKMVAMGKEEEALEEIEVSANTPKAVTMWMDRIELGNCKTEPIDKVDNPLADIYENVSVIEQVEGHQEMETKGNKKTVSNDSSILQSNTKGKSMNITNSKLKQEMESKSERKKTLKTESIKEQINRIVKENQCNICSAYPCTHKRKGRAYGSANKSKTKRTENRFNLETKHWLVCNICKRRVAKMKIHTRKVHGHVSTMEVVPCSHCCDWFPNNDALKDHITFHDIERDLRSELGRTQGPFLYCKLCSFNCYAKKLTRRVQSAKCKSGEKIVRGDQVMKSHIEKHGGIHPCKKCQKVLSSQYQLKEHTLYCWKVFQCDQCPLEFKCKTSLKNHVLGYHEQSYKYECQKCDKKFTNEMSLSNHCVFVHANMERVVCVECGKSFRNGRSLKNHSKSHYYPKAFVCNWDGCDKAFRLNTYLVNHIRTHTKEKPFECDQCKQTFRKTSHLHRHKKTHSGEKPFVCQTCCKGFIQKSNFRGHTCSSRDILGQVS